MRYLALNGKNIKTLCGNHTNIFRGIFSKNIKETALFFIFLAFLSVSNAQPSVGSMVIGGASPRQPTAPVTGPAAAALSNAQPSRNPMLDQVQRFKLTRCANQAIKLGEALIGQAPNVVVPLVNTSAPDSQTYGATAFRKDPQGGTSVINMYLSPTAKGCDAGYDITQVLATSCQNLATNHYRQYSQKIPLSNETLFIPATPTWHIYLTTIAEGVCMVVQKEIVY